MNQRFPDTHHRSALMEFLHTFTYRTGLLAVVSIIVIIGGIVWAIRTYTKPPTISNFGLYSSTRTPVPAIPSIPGPTHANLLDHTARITAEFPHYNDGTPHYGLDLDVASGTAVYAPVAGLVMESNHSCTAGNPDCGRGLGNYVWFQSDETNHFILLAHLQQVDDWVQSGVTFKAGARLGESGATGNADGPHIHLQVNPTQTGNAGSINPAEEFPWLHCEPPVLGARFGAACP